MTSRTVGSLVVATTAAIAVASPATAQSGVIAASGSLSNFDVFNDDPGGREAEGFDIEILDAEQYRKRPNRGPGQGGNLGSDIGADIVGANIK